MLQTQTVERLTGQSNSARQSTAAANVPGIHARRGLLDADSTVVFIHTGGLPALFAFSDEILRSLPA